MHTQVTDWLTRNGLIALLVVPEGKVWEIYKDNKLAASIKAAELKKAGTPDKVRELITKKLGKKAKLHD